MALAAEVSLDQLVAGRGGEHGAWQVAGGDTASGSGVVSQEARGFTSWCLFP